MFSRRYNLNTLSCLLLVPLMLLTANPIAAAASTETRAVTLNAQLINNKTGKVTVVPVHASVVVKRVTLPNGSSHANYHTDAYATAPLPHDELSKYDTSLSVESTIHMDFTESSVGSTPYKNLISAWGEWTNTDSQVTWSDALVEVNQQDQTNSYTATNTVGYPVQSQHYTVNPGANWKAVSIQCGGCHLAARTSIVLHEGATSWTFVVPVMQGT